MASNYQRQTSSHSAGDTITAAHLNDEFDYLYATVLNGGATTGIGTNDLMNDAVNGTKIADDAIDSEHYVDGSIDTAHLANDAVDADKLASNAVVDASIAKTGAFSLFGSWTTTDSEDATLEAYVNGGTAVIYQAQTDGYVCVDALGAHAGAHVLGKTDSNSTPATVRVRTGSGYVDNYLGFTMPVKKNDYWLIEYSSTSITTVNISWLPIGTGGCVKQ